MKNHNIGLLGGGMEQAALANRLAEDGGRQVYAMFLEGALLSPKVHTVRDFRDALWLCSVLVLPDPVCREGLLLNAPLWQEAPVDVGQFLGDIGKGVLLLAGEMTPEYSKACAAKEVPITPLSSGTAPEDWPEMVTAYLDHVQEKRVRPRAVKGPSIATDIPPSGRGSETARQYC